MIAHLAIRGSEHYDAVIILDKKESYQKSPAKRKDCDEHSTPAKTTSNVQFHTPHKAAQYISPAKRN